MKRLVLGPRAVLEAIRAHAAEIHAIYVVEDARRELFAIATEAGKQGVRVEPRAKLELDALAEGERHQGVVAVTGPYPYASLEEILHHAASPPLLLALDQLTDPHNLGAIVRSAVAFGADGILTLKDRAVPVTPVVVRTSAGATEHARIARVVNLARTIAGLVDQGFQVVGLDAEGVAEIDRLPAAPQGRVLVIGAEGKGLRRLVRERCTVLARIPQLGPVASLNASVAAGVALFCAHRQRSA